MNEDKYYIPEIEEFCIGLEFYVDNNLYILTEEMFKLILNHLTKDKTTLKDGSGLFKIDPINIRVKYLDKNDIESFGFILISEDIDKINYRCKYQHPDYTGNRVFYFSLFGEPKLIITGKDSANFVLTIKNKTELKKLLTQLGIL